MVKYLVVLAALVAKLALFAVATQPTTSADCPGCPYPKCWPGDPCECI